MNKRSNNNDKQFYDQVVNEANKILRKGGKYSVEKIRKNLGYGSSAEIAECIKKWQAAKHAKNKRNKNQKSNQQKTGSHRPFSSYSQNPFSLERLKQEPNSVQKLFWALLVVRMSKSASLEHYQSIEDQLMNSRIESEREIIDLKKQARKKVDKLFKESIEIENRRSEQIDALRQEIAQNL
jgi:hypothetical protein